MTRSACLLLVALAVVPSPAQEAPRPADGFPWPAAAVHRFGNRQLRQLDGIRGAVVSPDGTLLATTGGQTVVVWDLKTLTARRVLRDPQVTAHTQQVIDPGQVAFTPDSKSLVVCVASPRIDFVRDDQVCELAAVWDLATGERKAAFSWAARHAPAVWVTAGGKEVAVAADKAVHFFDLRDGKEKAQVALPVPLPGPACAAADRLAACSLQMDAPQVSVVDARTGKELHSFPVGRAAGAPGREPAGRAVRLALSPDGALVAAADEAGKVHVHDVGARKERATFDHPGGPKAGPLRVSADGKTLFLGGGDRGLYRWDLVNGRRLPDVGRHPAWSLTDLAPSPDGAALYSVGWDGLARRWDLAAGKPLPDPDGYADETFVSVMPDGRHLLVTDCAGRIDLWDLGTGKRARRVQGPGPVIFGGVAVSADGRRAACGRNVPDVQVWDLAAGKVERVLPLADKPDPTPKDPVGRLAFGPGDRVLYAASGGTGASAWDLTTGKRLWAAPGLGSQVAADPRGRWVAVGGGFSQDGNWEDHFRLLDAKTGAVVRDHEVHGFRDGPPRVGRASFFVPFLLDLTFTPDGSRLLTAHTDGTVRVWDPEAGTEVGRLHRPGCGRMPVLLGGLACSPDGKWLAVGAEDFAVDLWDLAAGKRAHAIRGHDSRALTLAFTRDGRGLVGNADLSPVLWSLAPPDVPAAAGPRAALWDDLAADDARRAYQAQWALVGSPKVAVELLAGRVKPADLVVPRARFDQWVADLDSPQFRVREAAEQALTRADGRVPVAWLRKALADTTADEPRARLTRVLAPRKPPGPADWRLGRAVQVLELVGSAEAKALLKEWATGDGSPLAEDAKAALGRLAR